MSSDSNAISPPTNISSHTPLRFGPHPSRRFHHGSSSSTQGDMSQIVIPTVNTPSPEPILNRIQRRNKLKSSISSLEDGSDDEDGGVLMSKESAETMGKSKDGPLKEFRLFKEEECDDEGERSATSSKVPSSQQLLPPFSFAPSSTRMTGSSMAMPYDFGDPLSPSTGSVDSPLPYNPSTASLLGPALLSEANFLPSSTPFSASPSPTPSHAYSAARLPFAASASASFSVGSDRYSRSPSRLKGVSTFSLNPAGSNVDSRSREEGLGFQIQTTETGGCEVDVTEGGGEEAREGEVREGEAREEEAKGEQESIPGYGHENASTSSHSFAPPNPPPSTAAAAAAA
eukprot:CAMPEP_0175044318 /NCGR_PEP_ID=MMETSP0052_2-20121109/3732_1 /TAXON_ID=51329 ORGANISM="Polytomella parva, Strain SAG 63-3" /NCGR_SAMPLE_ID=MMETSP0052_2 /ASSEMBLY_ACC=CAM_ASM_000194 /LENGTH=342 /DNA_ID=CAMNT_0016307587 /DNA_START=346 /DNA_END=1370 /DNA_ORIENTATION=+